MLFHDVKWKIKTKKTTNRRHEQLTHLAWTCWRTPNPRCRVNLGTEASLTPIHPMISTATHRWPCLTASGEWRAGDINSRAREENPDTQGGLRSYQGRMSHENGRRLCDGQTMTRRAVREHQFGWADRGKRARESVLLNCRTKTLLHQTHWKCTKWQSKGTVTFTLDLRNVAFEIHFNWNLRNLEFRVKATH